MGSPKLTSVERAKVFKALSDPRRVELLDTLATNGPQCGTELAERLGISIALLSHHWEVLEAAGLIEKTRVGQLRYCSLDIGRLHDATETWEGLGDVTVVDEASSSDVAAAAQSGSEPPEETSDNLEMAAKKKNSLVNNINKRKKAGKSRPKSKSHVSKEAYGEMQAGWPHSKKKKATAKKKRSAKKTGAKKAGAKKKTGSKKRSAKK